MTWKYQGVAEILHQQGMVGWKGEEREGKKNDKKSILLAGFETSPKLEIMTLNRAPFFYHLSAARKSSIY